MRFVLLMVFSYFAFLVMGCQKNSEDVIFNSKVETPIDTVNDIENRVYGKSLNLDMEIISFINTTLYKPKKIDLNKKLPVVLFAPGWGSKNHEDYKTLLTFIASQGYVVIYSKSPMEYAAQFHIERFSEILSDKNVSNYIDTLNFGVVGHSAGGGISFKIMDYFSKNGYGEKGKFIFSMDPWFAFGMGEDTFENFSKDTKVVIQQYDYARQLDPRIALTIFDRLSILGDKNRDYQIYKDLGHGYPFGVGSYDTKQMILKPLDALMDYVFNSNLEAYESVLELGSDDPYTELSQPLSPSSAYVYKCYGENDFLITALNRYGLDYCSNELGF